jgi:ATP-dependent protease HslVU (ClpYQ) peptidase subunit
MMSEDMTLILAIPAADGIVMASDGQITIGEVRTLGKNPGLE